MASALVIALVFTVSRRASVAGNAGYRKWREVGSFFVSFWDSFFEIGLPRAEALPILTLPRSRDMQELRQVGAHVYHSKRAQYRASRDQHGQADQAQRICDELRRASITGAMDPSA